MAYYGVALDIAVKQLNYEFRMSLRKQGGLGIRTLGTLFRRFDYNGNKKLDITEFEAALGQAGLFPKKVELQALMKYYDLDGDGNISYEEFLRGLREPLNERRKNMVDKIYTMMDRDGSGKLTVADIEKMYVVDRHPDFIQGRKTKEEILIEFLSNFEGAKGNRDGIVTREEFIDYYSDLSMCIPKDEYAIFCVFYQLFE